MPQSSYRKHLTALRARAAGRLAQAKHVATCRAAKLEQLEESVVRARKLLERSARAIHAEEEMIASCDRLLLKDDQQLDPAAIKPVREQAGRYGPHGGFGAALQKCLQLRGGAAVSTSELARELEARLGLEFELPALRKQWRRNTLLARLHYWAKQGWVKQVGYTDNRRSPTGLWRWMDDGERILDDAKAQALAVGLKVLQEDAPDDDAVDGRRAA